MRETIIPLFAVRLFHDFNNSDDEILKRNYLKSRSSSYAKLLSYVTLMY